MILEVRNKLLQLIPVKERLRILRSAELIELRPRQVLHHYRLPMEHVYFLESGLISVAAKVNRNRFVEVWLTGQEGLLGAPVVLAEDNVPLHRRTVQVSGEAYRLRTTQFCEILKELPCLRDVVDRYLAVVLAQTSQSGACNSYHTLRQRLARWLLVARNALDSDEIPLTHGVLADLLGVRRASVTQCIEVFQKHRAISARRGLIRIEKPGELGKACCGCFKLIEREYHRHLVQARDKIVRPQRNVGISNLH